MFARGKTWLSAISWKNITGEPFSENRGDGAAYGQFITTYLFIFGALPVLDFLILGLTFGIDQSIYFQIGGVADEWINRLPEPVSYLVSIAFYLVFYGLFFGGGILWGITLIALPFWLLYCLHYASKVRDGYWKAFFDKALFRV